MKVYEGEGLRFPWGSWFMYSPKVNVPLVVIIVGACHPKNLCVKHHVLCLPTYLVLVVYFFDLNILIRCMRASTRTFNVVCVPAAAAAV